MDVPSFVGLPDVFAEDLVWVRPDQVACIQRSLADDGDSVLTLLCGKEVRVRMDPADVAQQVVSAAQRNSAVVLDAEPADAVRR